MQESQRSAIEHYQNRPKDWIDAILAQEMLQRYLAELAKEPILNQEIYNRDNADLRVVILSSGSIYWGSKDGAISDRTFAIPRIPADIDLGYFVASEHSNSAALLEVWFRIASGNAVSALREEGMELIKPDFRQKTLSTAPSKVFYLKKHFGCQEISEILERSDIKKYLHDNGQNADELREAIDGGRDVYQEIQAVRGIPAIGPGERHLDSERMVYAPPRRSEGKIVWAADANDTIAYKLVRAMQKCDDGKWAKDLVDMYNILSTDPPMHETKNAGLLLELLVALYYFASEQTDNGLSLSTISPSSQNIDHLYEQLQNEPSLLCKPSRELAGQILDTVSCFAKRTLDEHIDKASEEISFTAPISHFLELMNIFKANRHEENYVPAKVILSNPRYKNLLTMYPDLVQTMGAAVLPNHAMGIRR